MKNLNLSLTPDSNKLVCQEILDGFEARLAYQGVKVGSAKARSMEVEFMAGAMATLSSLFPNRNPDLLSTAIPPYWVIAIMSGRSLLDQ